MPAPNRRLTRILATGLMAAMLVLPAAALADSAPSMNMGTTTDVGHGTAGTPVSFDTMFPGVTYIHEGDTITFTNAGNITPHTVSFAGGTKLPAPETPLANAPSQPSGGKYEGTGLLNSGMLMPGQSYAVSFTKAGVYDYVCILHPMMRGSVVVLPAGAPIPTAEQQAAVNKGMQMDQDAAAAALIAYYKSQPPSGNAGADGSVTWNVVTGAGLAGFDIEQFFPASLVISEGDSVTFTNKNMYEPHFVAFPTSPADAGKFFGAHGPDLGAMFTPMGGTVVDGAKLVNSGGLFPGQGVTLSFPKAGTYHYVCFLHGGNKMEGDVTVQAKGFVHAYLNGKAFVYNGYNPVHIHNGHVYVPVAELIKQLGGSVAWDGDSQTVSVSTDAKNPAQATAGQGNGIKVIVNGKQLTYGFDPQPHIHDGHVFVPAQVLVDALGGSLTWDAATTTLTMTAK